MNTKPAFTKQLRRFVLCNKPILLNSFAPHSLSKVVAETNSKAAKQVESSLPLQTLLKD